MGEATTEAQRAQSYTELGTTDFDFLLKERRFQSSRVRNVAKSRQGDVSAVRKPRQSDELLTSHAKGLGEKGARRRCFWLRGAAAVNLRAGEQYVPATTLPTEGLRHLQRLPLKIEKFSEITKDWWCRLSRSRQGRRTPMIVRVDREYPSLGGSFRRDTRRVRQRAR